MYGLTRGMTLLIAAGIAGGLVWLAGWFGPRDSTGDYSIAMGLLAAAGLVLVLSQLVGGWTKWGRPIVSAPVFLLGFLPVLVAAGWVVIAAQPNGNTTRDHVLAWSGDVGIGGVVTTLATLVGPIAFGLGLAFGVVFDTTGERRRVAADEDVVGAGHEYDRRYGSVPDRRVEEEPTAAERRHVAHGERDLDETRTDREPVAVGSRADEARAEAPPPVEPESRPRRRSIFRR